MKTRLVPVLGRRGAAALYRVLAETVLRKTAPRASEWSRVVRYAPARSGARLERWLPREDRRPQRGRGLGERMSSAFADAFDAGARRVVLVGSDLPELRRRHVQAAFGVLRGHDLVLGPARDGGYYLVGLRRQAPELFRGLGWSRPGVLARTTNAARALGLRFRLLEELSDLDTPADLQRLAPRLRRLGRTSGREKGREEAEPSRPVKRRRPTGGGDRSRR